MNEKTLSHQESLELIERMIQSARNKVTESGFHFFLWGILVVLASMSQYVMILNGLGKESNLVWLLMPVIGVPAALVYEFRRSKQANKHTSDSEASYGKLWLGFGITLALMIFLSINLEVNPISFILGLVGLATFVSGSLLRFSALTFGAVVFWIAAAACLFVSNQNQLLINAVATALGYLIPAWMLYQRSRKAHV